MATNYTIKEAVEILAKGTDAEAIQEIGRRFPILAVKIAHITAKAKDEFVDFMGFMPEYLTANKVNSEIKKTLISIDEKDDEEEDAEKPAKAAKSEKKKAAKNDDEPADEDDYASMTGKQLWAILGEKGLQADCKKKCGTKKAELLEYIEKYGLDGAAYDEESADDEENPYEGKSAMELFKECKKRGIKAQPKKPTKFYADLLIKDDEATADADDDDDWGDDKEDEPVKPSKSTKGKASKKAAKEEEDDDDNWDI